MSCTTRFANVLLRFQSAFTSWRTRKDLACISPRNKEETDGLPISKARTRRYGKRSDVSLCSAIRIRTFVLCLSEVGNIDFNGQSWAAASGLLGSLKKWLRLSMLALPIFVIIPSGFAAGSSYSMQYAHACRPDCSLRLLQDRHWLTTSNTLSFLRLRPCPRWTSRCDPPSISHDGQVLARARLHQPCWWSWCESRLRSLWVRLAAPWASRLMPHRVGPRIATGSPQTTTPRGHRGALILPSSRARDDDREI
ncbi:hypothetical protein BD289DRAFT_78916 [Coniella lustricola]|uniref:Uncharacterized protein n=1 Tax=Coniella lustricola TaxID=2025994 RepID=A0A2T2ZZ94_9PEZI|nr:hypothetical protein BD289DRAFT_78916 [Coniella lustricola]